jgi:hypothetical protein
MHRSTTWIELRKHPRAPLRLPTRIRWYGPLGMRLEVTKTIDASREGFLFHRDEPCELMARVWVAFPFDPAADAWLQPETPARIVRVESDPEGGFHVGVHLLLPPRRSPLPPAQERRSSPRLSLALPVFMRPAGTPWPEESMTQDISQSGARFETPHIYEVGDPVLAKIPWGEWARAGEIPGRVVRVEAIDDTSGASPSASPEVSAGTTLTCVAVQWIKGARS